MTSSDFAVKAPIERASVSPLDYAISERDRETLTMVRQAIARRDVVLAYQPIVQTARPDRPAFHEGLIRILDTRGRIIPAQDFIGAVEDTELGRKIDCLALELGLGLTLNQDRLPYLRGKAYKAFMDKVQGNASTESHQSLLATYALTWVKRCG